MSPVEQDKSKVFQFLSSINLNDRTKAKLGLTYLSWADAWSILKTHFPDAEYTIYTRLVHNTTTTKMIDATTNSETVTVMEYDNEVPYFTDGRSCYVKVGVTINGNEEVELLPVMDNKQNAVLVSVVSMTQVNKAIQRAFVKACARHGLGLYIYAGEDLPEEERKNKNAFFDTLDKNAVSIPVKANLTSEEFQNMSNKVINRVSNLDQLLPQNLCEKVINFIVAEAKGKKLSEFKFDNNADKLALTHIDYYIDELIKWKETNIK